MLETAGIWIGALLSLCLLSYLFGDNPVYRLAAHGLIGATIGYASVMAVTSVLLPRLVVPLLSGDPSQVILALVSLVGGLLLLLKVSDRWGGLGSLPMAFLVGVGVAVALAGLLPGTIVWQIKDTALSVRTDPGYGLGVLAGTALTLLAFQFVQGRQGRSPLAWLRGAGRLVLDIALGLLFAGAVLTSLAIFIDRVAALARLAMG